MNIILFVIIFGLINASFYSMTLGIDTLFGKYINIGSVYFNLGIFGLLETTSSIISIILIKYFKPLKLL